MKQLKFFVLGFSVLALTQFSTAIAASHFKLVNAKQSIENLDKALAKAKSSIHYTQSFSDKPLATSSFVAFPLKVPQEASKMYASFESTDNNAGITIDSTSDCKGAKFCNLGELSFQADANPMIYFDRNNKQATSMVSLNKNIQGFYTRGFAMADYSPAKIQWRNKEILYTLTWKIEDKNAFIEMANSVINQLP